MFRFIILILSGAVLVGCAGFSVQDAPSTSVRSAQLSDDLQQSLVQSIEAAAQEHRWQGISVSVARAEGLLFEHALGWASKEQNRPMTPETASMVGSVSKLFTVTAIMQLAEQGAIDLDAPVTEYLPELLDVQRARIDLRTPKVRHLLYHHAGYQSDLLHEFMFGETPPQNWDRVFASLPDRASDYYQVQQPDTAMAYSNLSFSLLGVIVERVSGMSFDQYTRQHLFEPLGMSTASFVPSPDQIESMAYGHVGGDERPYVYIRDLPAGSMIASSQDLTRYGRSFLNQDTSPDKTLLNPATRRLMLQQQNTRSPLDGDFQIGYGFWLNGTETLPATVPVAAHGGDIAPYHGYFMLLPEHNLTLAVLVNSPSSSMALGALAEQLAAEVLTATGVQIPPTPTATTGLMLADDANGVYAMPFGFVDLTYREKDQGYRIESPLVTFRGIKQQDNAWGLEYRLLGLFDLTPKAFETMSVRFGTWQDEPIAWLYAGGTNLGMMVPAEAITPTPRWLERTGTYEAVNDEHSMFQKMRVEWDKDRSMLLAGPYLGLGMGMTIPATPLDADRLQLQGYGRNLGDVLEWTGPDTFRYSGLIFQRD